MQTVITPSEMTSLGVTFRLHDFNRDRQLKKCVHVTQCSIGNKFEMCVYVLILHITECRHNRRVRCTGRRSGGIIHLKLQSLYSQRHVVPLTRFHGIKQYAVTDVELL